MAPEGELGFVLVDDSTFSIMGTILGRRRHTLRSDRNEMSNASFETTS